MHKATFFSLVLACLALLSIVQAQCGPGAGSCTDGNCCSSNTTTSTTVSPTSSSTKGTYQLQPTGKPSGASAQDKGVKSTVALVVVFIAGLFMI
ncbi:hypothetical protein BG003_003386 [Podila horticola]|nr:hypothetical protein BG003_003386 [Podila horticola]